ncbi:uncharacterized protein PHALS_03447 [Plasmopara halstedii]|uniref:Uncharacterized protein n=1 Tax=Plasmopara halstedii TaxID=4781 RepID=A0A0P1AWZ0_PLAHL|nr:uncharacterized protein PHALS_03447 [Plasmopara halstedii]CEG46765.1 hypothetical protein PHALS_03447 [Plasmopara halstedii]|eukprot:XP_024583134.1 hypothetical protein PHALS_03447 [Plasmopara halstedii]
MELRGSIPHLLCLYRDLTASIRSIVGAQGVLHGPVQIGDLSPPVGFVSDGVVHKFPELSKRDMRGLLSNTTFNLRDHPISHHCDELSQSTLSTIVQAFKELRQIALPVYSDLQFRLALKLLSTRSRFGFLQRSSQTALNCGYGCTSVETERHPFFECAHVVPHPGGLARFLRRHYAGAGLSPL